MSFKIEEYIQAQGFMRRKQFIFIYIALFFFVLLSQMFFIQQTDVDGAITDPSQIDIPLWGGIILVLAHGLVIPAMMMRARDAGWEPLLFGGVYGIFTLVTAFHYVFGFIPPAIVGMVVQLAAFGGVIALMIKPTSAKA